MSRTPYTLPEADCERLRRTEMNALRMLLALLSSVAYAKDDLPVFAGGMGGVTWRSMRR